MKKGEMIEGIVQRVDFPNKGVAETDEGACVVKNALPGQRVKCAVNKVRKGRAEGRLVSVLEPSPLECGSPCPHFGICGGCTYLSLPYEEQLKIKEAQVKKLLDGVRDRQGAWQFEGIKASPAIFGYRNKMEFSFGDEIKDGPLALGMHRRGSFYDIVSVTECRIIDGDYRKILCCVKEYFTGLQDQGVDISFYHRRHHIGYLRHLLVRKAAKTGEILIALVTTTQEPGSFYAEKMNEALRPDGLSDTVKETAGNGAGSRQAGYRIAEQGTDKKDTEWFGTKDGQISETEILEGFKKRLLALDLEGKIAGILHVRNDAVADIVRSDETRVLYGQDFFYEELLGLRFKVSAFSFFQTNSRGAEVLYQTVREYIADYMGPDESKAEEKESAVEQDKPAEREEPGKDEGEQGVAAGWADSVKGIAKDKIVYDLYSGTGTIAQLMAPVAKKVIGVEIVEEAVEAARKNAELNGLHNCEFIAGDVLKVIDTIEEKPDIIILDPPRDGIHPKALDKIIRYGVGHILYISCKPTSLARDLEVFWERGYEVVRVVAVDQFPWTANIEVVCLLSKLHAKQNIEVELRMSEMDLTAAESKATYEEIKEYVLEHMGLKVSNLYIAQIKQKCGIIERANYNLPKSDNSRQPKCPLEKEAAIREALEHFRMI